MMTAKLDKWIDDTAFSLEMENISKGKAKFIHDFLESDKLPIIELDEDFDYDYDYLDYNPYKDTLSCFDVTIDLDYTLDIDLNLQGLYEKIIEEKHKDTLKVKMATKDETLTMTMDYKKGE